MAEHNQRFETFAEWCNKASSWLTRHPQFDEKHFRAICFDSKGRICRMGADFMRAEFPVHWFWPDQILFEAVDKVRSKPDASEAWAKHIVDDWGATTFASMHTQASAAEYKRAFMAGFNAKFTESAP